MQQMLDDPNPKLAALKANYLAELWIGIDQAERRLNTLIEKFAQSQRAGFRIVAGGRHD